MKPSEKLKEIDARWKAFKHWNEKQPIAQYEDTAGPDVEWLINCVEILIGVLKEIDGNIGYYEAGDPDSEDTKEWIRLQDTINEILETFTE
jgi:hypothetical protein